MTEISTTSEAGTTEIAVFHHPDFGDVRTVTIEDSVWFVGKDVAVILGYKNTKDAILRHVDPEDKRGSQNTTPSGTQTMTVINESGLYSLILSSKLPKAKEFKRWVTSEVLPSIRRHGGYIAGQEQMTEAELVSNALLVANRIMEQRAQRIQELEAENASKTQQLSIAAPKAEYYDAFVSDRYLTNFRNTAKEIGIGERRMIQLLMDEGFLYRDQKNNKLPYKNKNRGYFVVRDSYNEKTRWMGITTRITPKGKQMIRRLCIRHNLIPDDNQHYIK